MEINRDTHSVKRSVVKKPQQIEIYIISQSLYISNGYYWTQRQSKEETNPSFECDTCKRKMEEGEFLAVIGKTPPSGLSMPLGGQMLFLNRLEKYIASLVSGNCLGVLKKNNLPQ